MVFRNQMSTLLLLSALAVAPSRLARRTLIASTAGLTCAPPTFGVDPPDEQTLEERLVHMLTSSRQSDVLAAEALIAKMERAGGSQLLAAEGIGSWGSWIGAWDVLYAGSAGFFGGPLVMTSMASRQNVRLLSARQFVYGPVDAAEDLRGSGSDGGTSTECMYAVSSADERVLLTRSGSFTKLPELAYRLDFPHPVSAFQLGEAQRGSPQETLTPVSLDSVVGTATPAGGATLRDISYLSANVWISRSRDDGGVLVLRRSDATPLRPPAQRPDLTAMCSEAIFTARGKICRQTALF